MAGTSSRSQMFALRVPNAILESARVVASSEGISLAAWIVDCMDRRLAAYRADGPDGNGKPPVANPFPLFAALLESLRASGVFSSPAFLGSIGVAPAPLIAPLVTVPTATTAGPRTPYQPGVTESVERLRPNPQTRSEADGLL